MPHAPSFDVCPPLSNRLVELGYYLAESSVEADVLICINHDPIAYKTFCDVGGSPENAFLVRLEPMAVFPVQYKMEIEALYAKVFTPGSLKQEGGNPLRWPYYYNQNPLKPEKHSPNLESLLIKASKTGTFEFNNWKHRPITISLIASNKVSPISRNNYKIRRRLASCMSAETLQIYGNLWDSKLLPKLTHRASVTFSALKSGIGLNILEIYGDLHKNFPGYLGQIIDKHEIIQKSKFSLVIENDDDYVSEKIIDALVGGSIPIYIGGDVKRIGIPPELIQSNLREKKEILHFIETFTDEEAIQKLRANQEWLLSKFFLNSWEGDKVFKEIADMVVKSLEVTQ
jgi:hypothetical protein